MEDEALPTPVTGAPHEAMGLAAGCMAKGCGAVLATVLSRRGSAPATPGQKLCLSDDGRCVGTVGGGALEKKVLAAMVDALARVARGEAPAPAVHSFSLGASLGMCCGGGVEVLVEAMAPAVCVGIVGAGHVGAALAPLLVSLGFAVTVVDARESWADPERVPGAVLIEGEVEALGERVSRRGAVLVMTHDHAYDQRCVEWALGEGYAFVGGVGSRAKALRTRARLEAKGVAEADIARVRMPIGLAIGARSPMEIAVSIAAELVAWRSGEALPEGARLRAPTAGAGG